MKKQKELISIGKRKWITNLDNDIPIIKDPPRMNEFKIDEKVRPFSSKNRPIKSVQLKKIDLNEKFDRDINNGKGFLITNEEDYDEKRGVRTEDGMYSPKYGPDTFSDKSFDNLYHCECGKLVGGVHEDEICPDCGTKVVFTDADLSITGYIPLGEYSVITPAMYMDIERLISKKELTNILKYNEKYDVAGHAIKNKSKASPFIGYGFINFKEHFDEIIEFYRYKHKDREDSYQNIRKFRKCVFTHVIPVYSSLLRPYVKNESRMSMFDDNRRYSVILANANIVRKDRPKEVDTSIVIEKSLFEIQEEWNQIMTNIINNELSGKKGLIRGHITAARINFSGRTIIAPATFHNCDEVSIPYVLGCELLRPLLINAIKTMDGKNVREANTIIDNAIREFDEKIYLLMNYIIQDSTNPPKIMVQRSPSLLQESMRLMTIKQIKADYDDLTTYVPSSILDGMNADFDGDTFSEIMIYDNRLKEVWDTVHSPRHHFISRHNGKYNELCLFIKDNMVILGELWELGKNSIYYDEWASDSEREKNMNKYF